MEAAIKTGSAVTQSYGSARFASSLDSNPDFIGVNRRVPMGCIKREH
jgi:hypothetical protein